MKYLTRTIYLGYYLKQIDFDKLKKFVSHVKEQNKISAFKQIVDLLMCIYKYNISILEYYQFGFYKANKEERKTWAGTGFMYEYQLLMNPKEVRKILDDKVEFLREYKDLITHKSYCVDDVKSDDEVKKILNSSAKKFVFKVSNGKCGRNILFKTKEELTPAIVKELMFKKGYNLMEEYIIQHAEMSRLSPSSVNTIRIFTQLNSKDKVEILGCRLRISVNSKVDNLAAGNIAAPIDENTGLVCGPGVYSDITKKDEIEHPVTKVHIEGFQVPFWNETIELVNKAAKLHPQNRSIGWDVVITENGPDLIEGNHDWCKLLWQLPVKKGLREKLEKYLNDNSN